MCSDFRGVAFEAQGIPVLIEELFPRWGKGVVFRGRGNRWCHFVAFPKGRLYNFAHSPLYSLVLYNTPHGDILQHWSVELIVGQFLA